MYFKQFSCKYCISYFYTSVCTAGWKITFFFSFMYIIFLIGEIVPCENIVHNNNNNNKIIIIGAAHAQNGCF